MASRLVAAQRTWTPEALNRLRAFALKVNPQAQVSSSNTPDLGFKPWAPWSSAPPSGSFDPALEAAKAAADRGYQNLQADTATQDTRDTVDYGTQRQSILLGRDQQVTDLGQGLDRGTQDYNRNVAMLQRAYQVKGAQQGERANAYGVLNGGALLQAAAKRQANQATDQQPLDTSLSRLTADTATGVQRTNDNANTALGKLALLMAPPDAGNPLGGRSFQDRQTTLTRAGRENTQFGIDTQAQEAYQASGTGWDPGQRPRGQFTDPNGNPYEVKVVGGIKYRVDPSGHVLSSVKRKRR